MENRKRGTCPTPEPWPRCEGSTNLDSINEKTSETHITPDFRERAYTTPFPLPDGRILCATTLKTAERSEVDLGLYLFDPKSEQLELVYNDPSSADFAARSAP